MYNIMAYFSSDFLVHSYIAKYFSFNFHGPGCNTTSTTSINISHVIFMVRGVTQLVLQV